MTAAPSTVYQKLIEIIAEETPVSVDQLHEQWILSQNKKTSFKEQLKKTGLLSELNYQKAQSHLLGIDFISPVPPLATEFQEFFTETIPIRFVKKFVFIPAEIKENELVIAVTGIWPTTPYEMAAKALNIEKISYVLATEADILNAINQSYDRTGSTAEEAAEVLEDSEDLNYISDFSAEETEDLLDSEDEEPIKKLMNSILFQSIKDQSSDIHIDPDNKETFVRYRIDGVLRQITKVPRKGHVPLVNRVKVMAGLDISTKNQPQDGRTMILMAGKKIDIRVSIIPTIHGERAVLRLLNQSQGIIKLNNLGIQDEMANQLEQLIHQPHGIILVTGPTGSGKTTTLYSALNCINSEEKNIVTIEDPVEYRIGSYGQMQVNEKIGVTFSKGLRAMLRQDPDVIMVGEMRDTETAQIAIQASLTGHLVFSTLHTNNAVASVIRLIDMGIEPFLVSSTVTAIIAQRLVRKICPHCREKYEVPWEELLALNFDRYISKEDYSGYLWRANGCEKCLRTGYQGRVGIYELLLMNDPLRHAISASADAAVLKDIAMKNGMKELKQDCSLKVLSGETTLDEMLRVVFTDLKQDIKEPQQALS